MAGNYIVGLPTWEEFFEGYVTEKIIEHLKSKKLYPDYAIICESTSLAINIAQRGRGEVILESFGKPAHSGHHKAGINAVLQLLPVMQDIEEIKPPSDSLLGEGPLVLTDIKSSPYPGASVVPEYCKVTYDRRLMVGETPEKVLSPIKKIIEKYKKSTKGKITVDEYIGVDQLEKAAKGYVALAKTILA